MKINYLINSFIVAFLFCNCTNPDPSLIANNLLKEPSANQINIDIQPFGNISDVYVQQVNKEISKFFTSVEIKKTIELPKSAFYKQRNRYRADVLIKYLMYQNIVSSIDHQHQEI